MRHRRLLEIGYRELGKVDPEGVMNVDLAQPPSAGIADAYSHALHIFETFDSPEEKPPRGMLLMGWAGTGKTWLMASLMRVLLEGGVPATWVNVLRFVLTVQQSYSNPDGPSRQMLINHVLRNDVVFLDDLGFERVSEDVDTLMYELIDGLYVNKRTVVIATNLTAEKYQDRYDEPIRSRIRGICKLLKVDGSDLREMRDPRYASEGGIERG